MISCTVGFTCSQSYHTWVRQPSIWPPTVKFLYCAAKSMGRSGYSHAVGGKSMVFFLWPTRKWEWWIQSSFNGEIIRHKQQRGMEVEFIPGGYTGALQILDKGINKLFKDHYWSQQLLWQIDIYENTKPKRQDVAKWIEAAWEKVSVESIKNMWKSIGIKAWEA